MRVVTECLDQRNPLVPLRSVGRESRQFALKFCEHRLRRHRGDVGDDLSPDVAHLEEIAERPVCLQPARDR